MNNNKNNPSKNSESSKEPVLNNTESIYSEIKDNVASARDIFNQDEYSTMDTEEVEYATVDTAQKNKKIATDETDKIKEDLTTSLPEIPEKLYDPKESEDIIQETAETLLPNKPESKIMVAPPKPPRMKVENVTQDKILLKPPVPPKPHKIKSENITQDTKQTMQTNKTLAEQSKLQSEALSKVPDASQNQQSTEKGIKEESEKGFISIVSKIIRIIKNIIKKVLEKIAPKKYYKEEKEVVVDNIIYNMSINDQGLNYNQQMSDIESKSTDLKQIKLSHGIEKTTQHSAMMAELKTKFKTMASSSQQKNNENNSYNPLQENIYETIENISEKADSITDTLKSNNVKFKNNENKDNDIINAPIGKSANTKKSENKGIQK